ncbi:glutathione peroxidase [Natranaerovirga hydrolytica]|uniref:Glutathione peroxidase n=1 Tax=Natranaerovirga hydrolytica TaxID=680378 RepID=A0A4R1MK90_9FIRM|nr:glutathione peroxidase [Natranaerovirga hydrolytica]TCK93228.1 glutathione peroxidase [Natranaerovirga hydrolytica]
MSLYNIEVKKISGETIPLESYKGKVLLIVNTASNCGFTPQYEELEALYQKYKDSNFEILGFPCNQFGNQEPGNFSEIKEFCKLNYGVTFPLFEKVDVKGNTIHPLFKLLTTEQKGLFSGEIKWNFTKFLIDSNGNVVDRFAPTTKPNKLENKVKKLLP